MAWIEYPWHPLHGRELPVVQRFTKVGLDLYWLEEQLGRSRVVPAWMCDAAACIGMAELGPPLVAVDALGSLAALLKVTAAGPHGRTSSEALPVEEASGAESSAPESATVARPRSKATAPVRAGSAGRAVPALADLLLAALGRAPEAARGGGDERQDQR